MVEADCFIGTDAGHHDSVVRGDAAPRQHQGLGLSIVAVGIDADRVGCDCHGTDPGGAG